MHVENLSLLAIIKNISYVAAFIATVEWLGFNAQALTIFIMLMLIDVFTGVVRSCVNEGCHSIKSSIGIRGVLSKILLLTALLSMALTSKAIGFEPKLLAQGTVNVLILAELYSILGNIHSAKTGKKKVEFDVVKYMLDRVKELLNNALK